MTIIVADPAAHEAVLDQTYPQWGEGLTRHAYGAWNRAQMNTPWGRAHLERVTLVDEGRILSSAKRYQFEAVIGGVAGRVLGLGAVFTPPDVRGQGHAGRLIREMLGDAERNGASCALLFSEIGAAYYERLGFIAVPRSLVSVLMKEKPGAPATYIRAGEPDDLPFISEITMTYAQGAGFALQRSADLIGFSIARKRLLSGLGPPGLRQTEFFVAEEGHRPAAYVVITRGPSGAILEECGDRDPAGARVGSMLQVLHAREPSMRQSPMRAWLPASFRPPQMVILDEAPAAEIMMVRQLKAAVSGGLPPGPVVYWQSDVF